MMLLQIQNVLLLFFSLFCFRVSNSSPLKTALNLQAQPQPPWVSDEHISQFYIRCLAGVSQTALHHLWHVNDSWYPRLLLPSNPPNASFKPQILFETSLSRSNSCQLLEIVSQGLSQLCSPPPPCPKLSFNWITARHPQCLLADQFSHYHLCNTIQSIDSPKNVFIAHWLKILESFL